MENNELSNDACGTCVNPKSVTVVEGGVSRRAILGGVAAALSVIGLVATSESAMAASKTYVACKTTDIKVKSAGMFQIAGIPVIITQPKAGVFKAFNGYCTHEQTPLAGVNGSNLVCNRHGATFDTTTGAATGGPTQRALSKISVKVVGNQVKVTI